MYLAELRIENLRMFGEGDRALVLPLRLGLTALVGENDSGKTTIIDALRLALGTRDQEYLRVEEADFHQPPDGTGRRTEIRVRCKFDDLGKSDVAAFVEHLTYEERGTSRVPVLYSNWKAVWATVGRRTATTVETRSGKGGDGPQLEPAARMLLSTTYLRPLRDAERAMSAGRGSRLSQILQETKEVTSHGQDYDPAADPPAEPVTLSVLGIGDYANALLGKHEGVQKAQIRLNTAYLKDLSFGGDSLRGSISVGSSKGDPKARLRQLLEKLELELRDEGMPEPPPGRGLGSNNLLFMACELLLLGSEQDAVPLLLIEEPEAHLHPQRQLRLIKFLQQKASEPRPDGQSIQILVTSHSPNLASAIDLESLVLVQGRRAFPLAFGRTQLDQSDYRFLQRFLDVTKANLFFARGVIIVEGDAENILVPTLARLIGRDLTENGVSIVNVGGVGLGRFARIFQRKYPDLDGLIDIPVACVTDLDVMPNCAPEIIGLTPSSAMPPKNERRWRIKADFPAADLLARRQQIRERASGQRVETFVADEWTLEYDLAYWGLERELWIAAHLARADEQISRAEKTWQAVAAAAVRSFKALKLMTLTREERASHVYKLFRVGSEVSKTTAAQYLARLLEEQQQNGNRSGSDLAAALPPYLVGAIECVTRKTQRAAGTSTDSTPDG
jgi:putative ATP-dependent endonuclease of the OLD family